MALHLRPPNWPGVLPAQSPPETAKLAQPARLQLSRAAGLYGDLHSLAERRNRILERAPIELRGKNLACWCKPGTECHADVLLKVARGDHPDAILREHLRREDS